MVISSQLLSHVGRCYLVIFKPIQLILDEVVPSETGIFSSLETRYFGEYTSVIEMSRKLKDRDAQLLLAQLKAEAFAIEMAGDVRIAAFQCGLLERIDSVAHTRYQLLRCNYCLYKDQCRYSVWSSFSLDRYRLSVIYTNLTERPHNLLV